MKILILYTLETATIAKAVASLHPGCQVRNVDYGAVISQYDKVFLFHLDGQKPYVKARLPLSRETYLHKTCDRQKITKDTDLIRWVVVSPDTDSSDHRLPSQRLNDQARLLYDESIARFMT